MTTSTAPAPESEPKTKHSLLAAMKRGREYAASLVMLVTLGHSLYASYFKEEEIAKTNYETTADTLTVYSREVKDQLDTLKLRISMLEDAAATPPACPCKPEVKPIAPAPAPTPPRPTIIITEEPDDTFDADGFSNVSEFQGVEPQSLKAVAGGRIIEKDPLIIDLPERPWEQQVKK